MFIDIELRSLLIQANVVRTDESFDHELGTRKEYSYKVENFGAFVSIAISPFIVDITSAIIETKTVHKEWIHLLINKREAYDRNP